MRNQPSGQVSHLAAGAVVLTARAAALLGRHLQGATSHDLATRAVIADLVRLSRPGHVSRDPYHEFASGAGESWLTTSQAAHRLGVTPAAVRKRISRGTLPARFTGHRWLIAAHDIESDTP